MTEQIDTSYTHLVSQFTPWNEWWTDLPQALERTDALVRQIVNESLSRIESDPAAYIADLRRAATEVEYDRAGYAGRLIAIAECYADIDPRRFFLYYHRVVPHILHQHNAFVRRQLIIADQIESSPRAFLIAARRRIVERDPLGYNGDPQAYAQDLRVVANHIEANRSAYPDQLRDFADQVSIDDPRGANEYRRAAKDLEEPISFSELFFGVERLYSHNIVSRLRVAADRINQDPTFYKEWYYRQDFDLLVAAHRSEHGSHAGPFRDWIVFLGFAGH